MKTVFNRNYRGGGTHSLTPVRLAFTLAEVLITLGIIGVVAAMTIPSLVQKYNEKVWITSYLRVYSILENAYKLSLNELGPVESWEGVKSGYENGKFKVGSYDNEFLYNTFKPYLKISSEFLDSKARNCMPDTSYYLNGNKVGKSAELVRHTPTVALMSGECITFGGANATHHSFFWLDTNGKKGPNTLGKDQFVFGLAKERLAPYAWQDTASECNIHDSADRMGLSCGSWIIKHRNMDYLHLSFEEVENRWQNLLYW